MYHEMVVSGFLMRLWGFCKLLNQRISFIYFRMRARKCRVLALVLRDLDSESYYMPEAITKYIYDMCRIESIDKCQGVLFLTGGQASWFTDFIGCLSRTPCFPWRDVLKTCVQPIFSYIRRTPGCLKTAKMRNVLGNWLVILRHVFEVYPAGTAYIPNIDQDEYRVTVGFVQTMVSSWEDSVACLYAVIQDCELLSQGVLSTDSSFGVLARDVKSFVDDFMGCVSIKSAFCLYPHTIIRSMRAVEQVQQKQLNECVVCANLFNRVFFDQVFLDPVISLDDPTNGCLGLLRQSFENQDQMTGQGYESLIIVVACVVRCTAGQTAMLDVFGMCDLLPTVHCPRISNFLLDIGDDIITSFVVYFETVVAVRLKSESTGMMEAQGIAFCSACIQGLVSRATGSNLGNTTFARVQLTRIYQVLFQTCTFLEPQIQRNDLKNDGDSNLLIQRYTCID